MMLTGQFSVWRTRTALAKGFSVAVVVVLLLTFRGAVGIWTDRYRVALAGTFGLVVVALLQGAQAASLLGLAVLLVIALVLGYCGRTWEHLK